MTISANINKNRKNIFQRKGEMLEMLAQINEEEQVNVLYQIMRSFLNQQNDDNYWFENLPEELQQRILEAKQMAIDNPSLMKTHKEVKKKYEKYLGY